MSGGKGVRLKERPKGPAKHFIRWRAYSFPSTWLVKEERRVSSNTRTKYCGFQNQNCQMNCTVSPSFPLSAQLKWMIVYCQRVFCTYLTQYCMKQKRLWEQSFTTNHWTVSKKINFCGCHCRKSAITLCHLLTFLSFRSLNSDLIHHFLLYYSINTADSRKIASPCVLRTGRRHSTRARRRKGNEVSTTEASIWKNEYG